ncbi:MAG: hypothetical protein A4E66_02589 [Syntrophus sp. PtaB.Bin001]|nr:MAG: hypothetical protein A4E66_02589 [Syntrophus sp. PtaB.Bin001]
MNAAVVEFDALADPVGPAAQDHDLPVATDPDLVRGVVRGIIVGSVFHAADGHGFPGLDHAQGGTLSTDVRFGNAEDLG